MQLLQETHCQPERVPKRRITALRAHVLAHVYIIVYMVVILHVLADVMAIALAHVKICAPTHVQVIVRVHALVLLKDHIATMGTIQDQILHHLVPNAKILVHQHAREAVKRLVREAVKHPVLIHVKVIVNQDVKGGVILVVKNHATRAAKVVAILAARIHARDTVLAPVNLDVQVVRVAVAKDVLLAHIRAKDHALLDAIHIVLEVVQVTVLHIFQRFGNFI